MSKAKKNLTQQLVSAVVPHLGADADTSAPPKPVAKTLRKLAKQVLKQQAKAAKVAKVPPPPAADSKQVRRVLADELTGALQPYLSLTEVPIEVPSKAITKTIRRLATELVKQRQKQAKKAAKAGRPIAPESAPASAQVARPKSTPPARRPTAKRSVSQPAPITQTTADSQATA